ncbi:MAG TPA: phosphate ABC transporter permease subunit PstC [Acidimicrobiales bacterium]|nr:phosphate ABC transporter permease subunit PstC [Acidimicrobiales bacterium]
MSDESVDPLGQGGPPPPAAAGAVRGARRPRPPRPYARRLAERALRAGSTVTAIVPLGALVAMIVVLLVEALPAIRYNGWHFLTGSTWSQGSYYSPPVRTNGILHPAGATYGAWPLILGTIETSAIAIAIGFPIAFGAAIFIVEKLPKRLAGVVGLCLELLAGIPSVVIGLWGVLTLGPLLARDVYPLLAHLPNVPVLNIFRGYVGSGEGLLTSGIVLAAMIIPIIAATTRDLLRQVPEATREGAEALGMTGAEVFRTVQLRWIRTGVIGAVILGLGRALGETIAVALVSGSVISAATNIYGTMTTIAATIVSLLDSAQGDPTGLATRSLSEAALVLLGMTLIVNIGARMLVRRSARGAALPVGVGF